jgi:putative DNA primase/helicase
MFHDRTSRAARSKWRGILIELGIPAEFLTGRHTACPICKEGRDRFRFDDREGRGTWICNQCGAGTGMDLAMKFLEEPFREVAARIDQVIGNVKAETPKPPIDPERRTQLLRAIYLQTSAVAPGDPVDLYLRSRGIALDAFPEALRYAPRLEDGAGGVHPTMVACVGVYGAPKYSAMHRTFLRRDGLGKAAIPKPRKALGRMPDGACVQLSGFTPGQALGIAEGIETALGAGLYFEMPVWSALNTTMLEKWSPPDGCTEVVVFGDNDASNAGQDAAEVLRQRLVAKGINVAVRIPPRPGTDWLDVWQEYLAAGRVPA